jgi:hypothetical protein
MLKGLLKDRKFHSHDEIEAAMTVAWRDLNFEDVQRIFDDWMHRLSWVIAHDGEYIPE